MVNSFRKHGTLQKTFKKMVEIVERIGRFTSSNIWKLTTVGTRKMTESELKEHNKQNPKSMKKNIDDGFGAPFSKF